MNRACLALVVAMLPALAGAGELSPLLLHPPRRPGGEALLGADGRVAIRLAGPADAGALAALRAAGAEPERLPSGGLAVIGSVVSATVQRHRLEAVAALPGVVSVEPARPLSSLPTLDRTAAQVQAFDLWWPPADELAGRVLGNIGEGVTVADHETACDPFHPDLFRPDAGRYDFEDRDHDLAAGPGDAVDLDGDGIFEAELSLLEGYRSDAYTGESYFHDSGYQPGVDWLYVDVNRDGRRNTGAREGFSDDVPAFGEPIFAGEDANDSGSLDPGEKLLRLGTAKVRAISIDRPGHARHLYRRGVDLSRFPVAEFDPDRSGHGTSALGAVAGGWPGVRRYTGLAPGAELLLIGHDSVASGVAAAVELGADVSFYEESSIVGVHDGSSAGETAISEAAAAGRVQVAGTGNLAGSEHCMELAPLGPELQRVQFKTDRRYRFQYREAFAVLGWPGAPGDVAWAVVGADGSRFEPGVGAYTEGAVAGMKVAAWQNRSDRGTTFILGFTNDGEILPEEVLVLEVRATGAPVTRFRGLLSDDQSVWAKGVRWLDHVSDAGTAITPATADRILTVAAHGGVHAARGWGVVGERRSYSGMGPRMDGVPITDLSAPDDPYVPDSEGELAPGYRAFSGTSGALPHVAAAAALVLAERPALGHDGVEELLEAGALHDEWTGDTPNEAYGHGKVRVARALGREPRPEGAPPRLYLSGPTAVVGREVEVTVDVEAEGPALVAFDVGNDGVEEGPAGPATRFRFVPERAGKLAVAARAIDPAGRQGRVTRVLEVAAGCSAAGCPVGQSCRDGACVADEPAGGEGRDGGGGDGGGCSTTSSSEGSPGTWVLLGLAIAAKRRKDR